jgi:hypothetical protein
LSQLNYIGTPLTNQIFMHDNIKIKKSRGMPDVIWSRSSLLPLFYLKKTILECTEPYYWARNLVSYNRKNICFVRTSSAGKISGPKREEVTGHGGQHLLIIFMICALA